MITGSDARRSGDIAEADAPAGETFRSLVTQFVSRLEGNARTVGGTVLSCRALEAHPESRCDARNADVLPADVPTLLTGAIGISFALWSEAVVSRIPRTLLPLCALAVFAATALAVSGTAGPELADTRRAVTVDPAACTVGASCSLRAGRGIPSRESAGGNVSEERHSHEQRREGGEDPIRSVHVCIG